MSEILIGLIDWEDGWEHKELPGNWNVEQKTSSKSFPDPDPIKTKCHFPISFQFSSFFVLTLSLLISFFLIQM
jgi:hypothetical protein